MSDVNAISGVRCSGCGGSITEHLFDFKELGVYCLECMTCSVCGKKAIPGASGEVRHIIGGVAFCKDCALSQGIAVKKKTSGAQMVMAFLSAIGFLLMIYAFFFMR